MLINQLLLSVYILTFLMGVPANIVAFCTFCCKVRRKAVPIDILLLNLTISDLIFLAFLPFKMKEASDNSAWLLPYPLCPLTSFIFYVTIYNSTLILTAVSVERYLGVAFPFRYSLCHRPRYAVFACVTIWVVTLLNLSFVYILPYFQWREADEVDGRASPPPTCYTNFTENELRIVLAVRLELFFFLFLIPFFVCSFCYVNFVLILSRLPNIGRRRRLRAIGLALGTLMVFTICFVPYNISHVVGFARQESQEWRSVALLSSTFNACMDPIIFYFSSATVRSMLNHCFRNIVAKLHILKCGAPAGPQNKPSRAEKNQEAPRSLKECYRPKGSPT